MRVLILGGTRFIGAAVANLAFQQGHEVTLFNRGTIETPQKYPIIFGDIERIGESKSELLATKPDIVVHCIAYSPKNGLDYVEVFKGYPARSIILSSVDCYESFQQANRGKEGSDFPVDETMPTSSIKYYWRGMGHHNEEYDKNILTDIVMEAHRASLLSTVVLRLPCVYGPKDHQYPSRHGSIIRRILDGKRRIVMGHLQQSQVLTHGYIENIAAAIVHTFNADNVEGRIFNIGEQKVRTWRRWCELYAEVANWSFDFCIIPQEIFDQNIEVKNLPSRHSVFDCTMFSNTTGFSEPIRIEEALRRTFSWAKKHPEVLIPLNYENEEKAYSSYQCFLERHFANNS